MILDSFLQIHYTLYALALVALGILGYHWKTHPRPWLLIGLCVFVLFMQSRLGHLHQNGRLLHVHEAVHYQMGSKYFPELGYTHLYKGLATGLLELNQLGTVPNEIRNLADKGGENIPLEDINHLAIKARFTPERWDSFLTDLQKWNTQYAPNWAHICLDAGYNPAPLWTVWGMAANAQIPLEHAYWFGFLDIFLLAGAVAVLSWGFGWKGALFGLCTAALFPPAYFAFFNWNGGSVLRLSWVFWMSIALSAYHKQYFRLAGAAIAAATLERVFPGAWALAAIVLLGMHGTQTRKWQPLWQLIQGGALATMAALSLTTLVLPANAWPDFISYIGEHNTILFSNHFGWLRALAFHPHMGEVLFSSSRPHILTDWSTILMERASAWYYQVLRIGTLWGVFWWGWRQRGQANALTLAWCGFTVVFLFSVPAHYYLVILLPLAALTFACSQTLFLLMLSILLIATIALQAGEHNLGWSLASLLFISAVWSSLTSLTNWGRRYPKGAIAAGATALLLPLIPQMQPKWPMRGTEVTFHHAPTFSRTFIDPRGREITDTNGRLIPNGEALTFHAPELINRTLLIRTDRFFSGQLLLQDLQGNTIHQWDVQQRGYLFDYLTCVLPEGSNAFQLTWRGASANDKNIGIFTTKVVKEN